MKCKGECQLRRPYKLKPIDVKDIEKPDKYDTNIAKFTILYKRFRVPVEIRLADVHWRRVARTSYSDKR